MTSEDEFLKSREKELSEFRRNFIIASYNERKKSPDFNEYKINGEDYITFDDILFILNKKSSGSLHKMVEYRNIKSTPAKPLYKLSDLIENFVNSKTKLF